MTIHRFGAGVAALALVAGGITSASCAGGSNGSGTGGTGGATGGGGTPGTGGGAGTGGSAASGGSTGAGGAQGPGGVTGSGGTHATGGGSGGATGNGGASGSGGTAGGGGTATAGVCPSNAVLCDDFESGTAGQAPNPQKWMVDLLGGNGTVQIDGSKGHNSSKSLHVNGNGSFHTMAQISGAPVFPLPHGVLYARAYLMLPGAMPSGHVIWIEAGSVTNDVAETRFGSNISQLDVNHWPGDQEQRAPGTSVADGKWHCVEIMYDSVDQLAEVLLDSTELTDLYVTNWVAPMQQNGNNTTPLTSWSPDYEAIRFGWELGGAEIWYDDVAIGYSPLPCAP